MKSFKLKFISSLLCSFFLVMGMAQKGDSPYHKEAISVDFGINQGIQLEPTLLSDEISDTSIPLSNFIKTKRYISTAQAAPWVQLRFENVSLGENSFLTIQSTEDGDIQRFDKESISVWNNWSAFFKGGKVAVTLHVAPNEKNITLKAAELLVGDFVGGAPINLKSQCGTADNRTQSSINMRDGRIMPVTCTGWMHAGGFYATAGHCLDGGSASLNIMEFEVPASLCDGTTQPAVVNNQYPVIYSSIVWENGAVGDDWGFYDVGANSNTNLTPFEARRSYYHLTKANPTSSIQIRGYGSDNVPLGCNNGRNADNFTLQWHTGTNRGETINDANSIFWEYQADTEGGNSGSAIRAFSNPDLHHAIGIHTNAGCSTSDTGTSGNTGTSFEADDVEAAMNTFRQTQVEYVAVDHYLSNVTGTTVLPHYLLQNALNQANAGHGPLESALELILIAGSNRLSTSTLETGGIYAEVINFSGATNGVILRSTCGAVKIGPNATAFTTPIPQKTVKTKEEVIVEDDGDDTRE